MKRVILVVLSIALGLVGCSFKEGTKEFTVGKVQVEFREGKDWSVSCDGERFRVYRAAVEIAEGFESKGSDDTLGMKYIHSGNEYRLYRDSEGLWAYVGDGVVIYCRGSVEDLNAVLERITVKDLNMPDSTVSIN